jgi:urease accessory protein
VNLLTARAKLNKTRTVAVAGTAHLRFACTRSKTVLERSFATSPVKLFATRNCGSTCWVCSATLGGGLVGGDAVHMTVEVKSGARALITTQASTKVYRSLRPASQTLTAAIEDDGLFAVIPDPIVCFAGADFSQAQHYELTHNANLIAIDWVTSGRHATGERWAFARFESRIEITRERKRVLYDGRLLRNHSTSIAERMGRMQVYVTAVLTGPLVSQGAETTAGQMQRLPISKQADLIESSSPLADGGTLLRIAGVDVEEVAHLLRQRLAFLHPLLGDDPWSRKW